MNMVLARGKMTAKADRKERTKKREKIQIDPAKTLKEFWGESGRTTAVLSHNGIVLCAWACLMFLVAYVALQAAFYFVAIVLGQTGGILMETAVDVITVYVVIAMVCAFDLFFAFKLENACIRAMKRRFWKVDRWNKSIDKGDLWRERHPAEVSDVKDMKQAGRA